jgi:hypothetical protein
MIRLGQSEANGSKDNETFTELNMTILGTQIKTLPRLLTGIPIFKIGSFDEFQMFWERFGRTKFV